MIGSCDFKPRVRDIQNDIRTFADCPDREENLHDDPATGGGYDGFCRLGARRTDFSYCHHPTIEKIFHDRPKIKWCVGFCEVACREGVCPRGFTR